MIIEAKPVTGSYGLMPKKDFETMDTVLDAVCKFSTGVLNTLELGIHKGYTSRGIHDYLTAKGRLNFHTGIDNGHDVPVEPPFDGCHVIFGNTYEVYNQVKDSSQHLLFIDANHSYPMVILDFWLYCKKVRPNGYIIIHDTGKQIKPFTDYQDIGSREDPDMFISARKAASDLGLLNPRSYVNGCQFEIVMDVWDDGSLTGGMLVLKKIT